MYQDIKLHIPNDMFYVYSMPQSLMGDLPPLMRCAIRLKIATDDMNRTKL